MALIFHVDPRLHTSGPVWNMWPTWKILIRELPVSAWSACHWTQQIIKAWCNLSIKLQHWNFPCNSIFNTTAIWQNNGITQEIPSHANVWFPWLCHHFCFIKQGSNFNSFVSFLRLVIAFPAILLLFHDHSILGSIQCRFYRILAVICAPLVCSTSHSSGHLSFCNLM